MILIVNRSKKYANSIAEFFYYMGILSHATTPSDALNEISTLYRAVLVIDPETLPDPIEFVQKLRSYSSTPIFSISTQGDKTPLSCIFDGCFKHAITSARLASTIAHISHDKGLPVIGDYRLSGINAICDLPDILFFDKPISFTKTEKMILRYLIRTYPIPQSSKAIIKYAFKQTRQPSPETVKTHVCSINKKFAEFEGRNLIGVFDRRGYVIYTPEILLKIKKNENILF